VLKEVHKIANAFGSHVTLLHAISKQPVVVDIGVFSPTVMQTASPAQAEDESGKLVELCESLGKFGVSATARQIPPCTAEELLDEAQRLGADLIVVGCRGHGPLHQLLAGSITGDILRHPPCPVVFVPHT
jgi:nucleotide-binding universal stress UspA family protein